MDGAAVRQPLTWVDVDAQRVTVDGKVAGRLLLIIVMLCIMPPPRPPRTPTTTHARTHAHGPPPGPFARTPTVPPPHVFILSVLTDRDSAPPTFPFHT